MKTAYYIDENGNRQSISAKFRRSLRRLTAIGQHNDPLARRSQVAAYIAEKEQLGHIAVVESGMDCDCVRYSGRVHMIPASVIAYEALDNRLNDSADGPYSLDIITPSEAQAIAYHSSDLALEAFENGHSHVVYY